MQYAFGFEPSYEEADARYNGEIDPESLFNKVVLYYEPGVWRLNLKPHIMRPGIEVEEDPMAYQNMGMHATKPQGIRGILKLRGVKGSEELPQSYFAANLGASPGDEASGLELYRRVATGKQICAT